MALTYGFYNSLSKDRMYNAVQISEIFDGIIGDGIYESIGDWFTVKSTTGMNITVGTGRAWFNHTWTKNDAPLPLTVEDSHAILNRIDTVVLEVNADPDVRTNFIKIISGTPANEPVPPTLIKANDVYQYPLADIYVAADVTSITQSNITNRVGTSDTPFVVGVLEIKDVDNLIAQWQAEWEEWTLLQKVTFMEWRAEQQAAFTNWFENLQYVLDGDVAGHLQNQINDIQATSVRIEEKTNDEYDALTEQQKMNGNIYDVGDPDQDDGLHAAVVAYDNTVSGRDADDTQAALDQAFSEIDGINIHKVDTNKIANNLTTTAEGYVLDARQGKVLNDALGTKAPLEYTLVGYKVGTASLNLPSNWQELLICVAYSSTIVQCIVPKGIYGQIYMGANISGWVGGNVVVNATSTHLISMWNNGSAVTNSSTMYVYYK